MTLKLASVLVAVAMFACGTERVSPTRAPQDSAVVSKATELGSSDLPAPRVRVSFEQKYVRAFPLGKDNAGKPRAYHQVVDQWVFHPGADEAKDATSICVGDRNHCIELWRLQEQLNRPANDPLGIRDNNKQ